MMDFSIVNMLILHDKARTRCHTHSNITEMILLTPEMSVMSGLWTSLDLG